MDPPFPVDAVDQGSERRRLALPRRSREEHEAALEPGQLDDGGRKAELFHGGDPMGDATEGRRHRVSLPEYIDPEARHPGTVMGEVELQAVAKDLALGLRHDRQDHSLGRLGGKSLGIEPLEPSENPQHGGEAGLDVDVAGIFLRRATEDVFELLHSGASSAGFGGRSGRPPWPHPRRHASKGRVPASSARIAPSHMLPGECRPPF